jgi:tRNA uridine 5-carboxymethylaminomethyl modification enzyme
LDRSALYSGLITGTGVRYCPSVEDKIVKFPDKVSHHVFIEPEGRNSEIVYPNGLSNSLPKDAQRDLIHSVPGLEEARIVKWAYAIEYDFSNPTQLRHTLESGLVEGLYLAGQINGTTGYEEAAVQGFVAGINAARAALDRPQITFSRSSSYIGVLIDDLVTKGTDEPYRMFTSRAERRLILRQDNARFRMLDTAGEIGIVDPEYPRETALLERQIAAEIERLGSTRSGETTLAQILRRPETHYADLPGTKPDLHSEVMRQVEIRIKYEGYIRREEREAQKALELEHVIIPGWVDYRKIPGLRREAQEKLSRVCPRSIGQVGRIPGLTPADAGLVSVWIKKGRS